MVQIKEKIPQLRILMELGEKYTHKLKLVIPSLADCDLLVIEIEPLLLLAVYGIGNLTRHWSLFEK